MHFFLVWCANPLEWAGIANLPKMGTVMSQPYPFLEDVNPFLEDSAKNGRLPNLEDLTTVSPTVVQKLSVVRIGLQLAVESDRVEMAQSGRI